MRYGSLSSSIISAGRNSGGRGGNSILACGHDVQVWVVRQSFLTNLVYEHSLRKFEVSTQRNIALMNARKVPRSSLWLTAIPAMSDLRINNTQFRHVFRYFAGSPNIVQCAHAQCAVVLEQCQELKETMSCHVLAASV
jgi:hypothetical protein